MDNYSGYIQSRGKWSLLFERVQNSFGYFFRHAPLSPVVSAARNQKTPLQCNRFLLLSSYVVYSLLTARVYFAWPNLSNLLFRSEAYIWLCEGKEDLRLPENGNKRYKCEEQNSEIGKLFVTCLAFAFSCSLIAGLLLDLLGAKMTAVIGQVINLSSWILLAFSSQNFQSYFPAFILMGIGSDIGYLPLLSVANLFPVHEGLIIALLGAAKSGSFAIPTILDIVERSYENVSLLEVCIGYASLGPGLCIMIALFLIPLKAFRPWNEFLYINSDAINTQIIQYPHPPRMNSSFYSYEAHTWRDNFNSFDEMRVWINTRCESNNDEHVYNSNNANPTSIHLNHQCDDLRNLDLEFSSHDMALHQKRVLESTEHVPRLKDLCGSEIQPTDKDTQKKKDMSSTILESSKLDISVTKTGINDENAILASQEKTEIILNQNREEKDNIRHGESLGERISPCFSKMSEEQKDDDIINKKNGNITKIECNGARVPEYDSKADEFAKAPVAPNINDTPENEDIAGFWKQFFSSYYWCITFYSVIKAIMYAFFTTGGENLLGKQVNDFMGATLPFSCIPCLLIGKIVDTFGIMVVLFFLNSCITLAYAMSLIQKTLTSYVAALCYICYVSFYSSQSYCFVSDTFSSNHFGKFVGTIHMIAGFLSLLKIPMQSMVVHVFNSVYTIPCCIFLCFCIVNFIILIFLAYKKKKQPHPYWPQVAQEAVKREEIQKVAKRKKKKLTISQQI